MEEVDVILTGIISITKSSENKRKSLLSYECIGGTAFLIATAYIKDDKDSFLNKLCIATSLM